jgi:hypothetical protein
MVGDSTVEFQEEEEDEEGMGPWSFPITNLTQPFVKVGSPLLRLLPPLPLQQLLLRLMALSVRGEASPSDE